MEKKQVTYSKLIIRNSSQQPDGRPQRHKNEDASTEQEVAYAEIKNSESSQQQQQHRKSKNISNRGPEQQVTYTEVKNSKPSKQQQHRRYKDAKNAGLESEQQGTYTDLKWSGQPQLQVRCEVGQSQDSLSPPWRPIAGILGILCLGLVVTTATMALQIFQTPSNHGAQNTTSLPTADSSIVVSSHGTQNSSSMPTTGHRTDCSCSLCPGNWVQFNMSCYLYSTELKPWKESQQACKSQNSSLLKINKRKLGFFKLFKFSYWIGLSRAGPSSPWWWEDGTTYSSNYLFTSEGKGKDCALFSSQKLIHTENCALDKFYVCERKFV
ncbi:natural killer cells antigen CD94-like [Tachyglossus aculeatus]|uniref:natural killer cells antigen CD94-like n=1 Tax=Tachyglossus aculeatus TaxID=9261 RepID=UPI0018F3F09F|nr:natural killer cells antigen CD94-like [Tachyglossus aculeatus]